MSDAGFAPHLPEVTAVLHCGFLIPLEGGLTPAEWVALSDGLQTRFGDVEIVRDPAPLRAEGVAEDGAVMVARSARDPATLLVKLMVRQVVNGAAAVPIPDDSGQPAAQRLVAVEVLVMRRADGS